jgi:Protein of unknown function (DUF3306)
MSDQEGDRDKGFLSRWSQRKQEAKQLDAEGIDATPPPALVAAAEAEPEVDLSSLPKIEDLTETSDITAFLRKGIPEHLRNAALRKSWALDPAIRNYVSPALEYAYDWNTPGGVPGGGEIAASTDVAGLVARIMGTAEPDVQPELLDTESPAQPAGVSPVEADALQQPGSSVRLVDPDATPLPASGDFADRAGDTAIDANPRNSSNLDAVQQGLRRHGTAKPRFRQKFFET